MSTNLPLMPADVARVRALALGLGYSAQTEEVCLQDLLTAARGSVTTLQQAFESLLELDHVDAEVRRRSCRYVQLALHLALDHPVSR